MTPHFNQNQYISVVDWNIENSRLHCHPENQPFLPKKWLKWLKVGKNTICQECHIVRSWLTPYFKQNRYISVVDWNIENSRHHYRPQNQPFLAKKWLKWLKMGKNTISRECHLVRSWLTPHFDQNRYISIVDWNIENSRLHHHPKNQPFLAKKWLKWLKMGMILYCKDATSPVADWPLIVTRIVLFSL